MRRPGRNLIINPVTGNIQSLLSCRAYFKDSPKLHGSLPPKLPGAFLPTYQQIIIVTFPRYQFFTI
jgi:hypothetical protein